MKAFETFDPTLLQQICYYGYYEDLEKGITCEYKLLFVKIGGNKMYIIYIL